jgi:hypothetical protein
MLSDTWAYMIQAEFYSMTWVISTKFRIALRILFDHDGPDALVLSLRLDYSTLILMLSLSSDFGMRTVRTPSSNLAVTFDSSTR